MRLQNVFVIRFRESKNREVCLCMHDYVCIGRSYSLAVPSACFGRTVHWADARVRPPGMWTSYYPGLLLLLAQSVWSHPLKLEVQDGRTTHSRADQVPNGTLA